MNFNSIKKIIPILGYQKFKNETILISSLNNLLVCLTLLKGHIAFQYNLLSCISGVDSLNNKYRFSIVYELLSLRFNARLRLKVFLNELNFVPSIVFIFKNANWWEREIWDMFGIYFKQHPDLRRILTDYGFEGYPMRKDFPLTGFIELRYNDAKKKKLL